MSRCSKRHILHVDMDAFYAAVEQRDQPELQGRPVLVGGRPDARGVVSAASYEAREFGCHSAMPMKTAVRVCPQAVVLPVRMSRYVEVSRHVFDIFHEFTPLVEPLSIDEAFLDVTGCRQLFGPPEHMARQIKTCIKDRTGLTASVGVAPNKFLAKLASDLEKPDGLVVVHDDRVQEFLDPLPISKLWGVGKATLPRFERLGLATFADVRTCSETQLHHQFGSAADEFYLLVRGIDDRPVVPERDAKSISSEMTFPKDIDDHEYLRSVLLEQTDHVAGRLRRETMLARTVTLKIRLPDFTTITRSATIDSSTDQTDLLWKATADLFAKWSSRHRTAVRLIGMGVSSLTTGGGEQLPLFEMEKTQKRRELDRTVDQIRGKFGRDAISRGVPPRPVGDDPDV